MPTPPEIPIRIVETYGRGLLRAIRSQFSSPTEAACELVDNALDHCLGQSVAIDLQISNDGFQITNVGGRGMGPVELAAYVAWGGQNTYEDADRGWYGQGGKAALCYLGQGFRLWCRRSEDESVYLLQDSDVMSGSGLRDYGEAIPLLADDIPEDLRAVPIDLGFVRIQSVNFRTELSLTASGLSRDVAAIYAPILRATTATIEINGTPVQPPEIRIDEDLGRVPIEAEVAGVGARGWVAKADRAANRAHAVSPGFALYWRGRRVMSGVWFGANAYAKGSVAALYGELELTGVTPNLNKTGFAEAGEVVWDRLSDEILMQAAPIIDALRSPGGLPTVTSRDLRLARTVRAELEEILRELGGTESTIVEEEIRVIITRGGKATGFRGVRENVVPGRRDGRSREPDERGARRGRAEREMMVRSLPEVVIDAWNSSTRSEIRDLPDGRTVVAINKAHPVWSSANARYAIAEGVITEVYRRGTENVETFIACADEALAIWGQRQREADEE